MRRAVAFTLAAVIVIATGARVYSAYTADDTFYNGNNILFYDPNYSNDACTNDDGGTTTTGKGDVAAAYNYFIKKGLSAIAASAVVGNLEQESSLNPKAVNPTSNAYGLAQWLGDRLTGLKQLANYTTLNVQLGYIWAELNGGYKTSLEVLQDPTIIDPGKMALLFGGGPNGFGGGYEGYGDGEQGKRADYAEALYKQYGQNTTTAAATTDGTDTTTDADACADSAENGGTRGVGAFKAYTTPARGWWSGASGAGIDNGSTQWGDERGSPADAISTWIDGGGNGSSWGGGAGVDGGAIAGFKGLADIAIGGPSDYNAAANGSMDDALTALLQRIRAYRMKDAPNAPTVIRPFHEWNGNWYPWSVNQGNLAAFRKTAERWSAIAKKVYPEAIWEFSPNGQSITGVTAEQAFEDGVWDAVGVDRYNQFPWIGGGESFEDGSNLGTVEDPLGIEKWREFAQKHNVPLGLPEYSNNDGSHGGGGGDDGYWPTQFFAWVKQHAGTGPGQVFDEIWFNVTDSGQPWLMIEEQPNTRAAYNKVFQTYGK